MCISKRKKDPIFSYSQSYPQYPHKLEVEKNKNEET